MKIMTATLKRLRLILIRIIIDKVDYTDNNRQTDDNTARTKPERIMYVAVL